LLSAVISLSHLLSLYGQQAVNTDYWGVIEGERSWVGRYLY